MPFVEREDGARLFWQARGEGAGVLIALSYLQHPQVHQGLEAELARGHRIVGYDARGAGESTRTGPWDMATDVADLLAVAEAAAPIDVVIANGDATNRAVHATAERPDLIPSVISLDSIPLLRGQAEGTDALVASGGVLDALVGTLRADFRSGITAAVQRGNPNMTQEQVRERVDLTVAYNEHDAAVARLEAWINDDPGDHPRALGDRLVIAYEGAGAWFTSDLVERGQGALPEAQFVKLDAGSFSRPDLAAEVVRRVTGVAAPT